jgi:hypothetical protein
MVKHILKGEKMADNPPYMVAAGSIPKILEKVKHAKTPTRFTYDFIGNKLGFKGGNQKQFIPLAKRLGLLTGTGEPTELYTQFRGRQSKEAMAKGLKNAYADFFERNEKAYELSKEQIKELAIEVTGESKNSPVVKYIANTFWQLLEFADFKKLSTRTADTPSPEVDDDEVKGEKEVLLEEKHTKLGFSYNINLVLPKTNDIAVFNAIFKSLRDNLLR